MKSFLFSLGNSSTGPIGFCARINAENEEEALAELQARIEGMRNELHAYDFDESDRDGWPEYLDVYLNPDAITVADIDESDEIEDEDCEHDRTRCDDGVSTCLDCGDRIDLDAEDEE